MAAESPPSKSSFIAFAIAACTISGLFVKSYHNDHLSKSILGQQLSAVKIDSNTLNLRDQKSLVNSMDEVQGITAKLSGGGVIPAWLKGGTLLSNGPGLFEFGDEKVSHLFDGMAMIRRFAINGNDTMEYSRKFVESKVYRANRAEQKQTKSGLGSSPSHWSFTQR